MPALRHAESEKSLQIMMEGSNLLKHCQSGVPHLRYFQLTKDNILLWYSGKKDIKESQLDVNEVNEIKIGQLTKAFKKFEIPALAHLSFSLITEKVTLDITCKDEQEFDQWVTGFKALMYHFRDMPLNKQILLSHSRRFNIAIKQQKISEAGLHLFQQTRGEAKTLEECMNRKAQSKEIFETKLGQISNRLTDYRQEVDDILADQDVFDPSIQQQSGNLTIGSNFNPYAQVLKQEEAETNTTQQDRLDSLLRRCEEQFKKVTVLFEKKTVDPVEIHKWIEDPKMHDVDLEMWRLEIDVENVSDILARIKQQTEPKLWNKIVSWFK